MTLTALATAVLLGLTGCSGDSGSPTGGDPVPSADSGASADQSRASEEPRGTPVPKKELPPETRQAVKERGVDYFETLTNALKNPADWSSRDAKAVPGLTGTALEELFNTATEYDVNGWRVVGRAVVVRQKVASATSDPDQVMVRVCVDNSAVRLLDRRGDEVPHSRPPRPRTLNLLTLVRDDESWAVSAQRPANRPGC